MSFWGARRSAPALAIMAALAVTPTFDSSSAADPGNTPRHPDGQSVAARADNSSITPIQPVAPGVQLPVQPAHPPLAEPTSRPDRAHPGGGAQPPSQGTISKLADSGVPQVALLAYHNAATGLRQSDPSCQLPWALLAGIGRVESDQGQYGGASLLANGNESKPIIGPRLDGRSAGMARVVDTDQGRYDGDRSFDRAVGPLQFLPATWSAIGVDADGNGVADPQNIFDAAASAGRYLCAGGDDLGTPAGQRAAVLRYNHSDSYADLVLALMTAYARGDSVGTLPSDHPLAPPVQAAAPPAPSPFDTGTRRRDGQHGTEQRTAPPTSPPPTSPPPTAPPPTSKPPTRPPPTSKPPTRPPPTSKSPTSKPPPQPPPKHRVPVQPLLPPSVPLHLQAQPASGGQTMQLDWTAPANKGSGLSAYRVTVVGSDGARIGDPTSLPATTRQWLLPTLSKPGLYTVSVTAWAQRGAQLASSQSATITVDNEKPTLTTAESGTCASISCKVTASWTWTGKAPAKQPTGYAVRLVDGTGATVSDDVSTKGTTATLTASKATVDSDLHVEVWAVFGDTGVSETVLGAKVALTLADPQSTATSTASASSAPPPSTTPTKTPVPSQIPSSSATAPTGSASSSAGSTK